MIIYIIQIEFPWHDLPALRWAPWTVPGRPWAKARSTHGSGRNSRPNTSWTTGSLGSALLLVKDVDDDIYIYIYILYYIYICLNFQLMILNMFFFELIWSGLGGFEAETYYLDLFRSVSFVAILQWRLQQIVRVWGVHFQPKFQAVLAKLPWYSDERLDTIEFGRHWRHLGSSMRLIRPWRKALSWLSLLPMKLMWIAMEAHQTCSWECFHI